MALTQTQVSRLYVCLFGRASEGEGNEFWQTAPASTGMAAAARAMLGTEAAASYFGDSLESSRSFIEHIYLNTLGKTYAEDTTGVEFWAGELDRGRARGDVVAALISAAVDPATAGNAQDRFNNRVAVSDYAADHISGFTDFPTFTGFIDTVTHDAATVTAAKSEILEQADADGPSYAVVLTRGMDAVAGTTGDDLIVGRYDTYSLNDTIQGGDGDDTLSLMLFGRESDGVVVAGVEHILIRNAWAGNDIDASLWSGVGLLTLADGAGAVSVSGLREAAGLKLDNNNRDVTLAYADDVLAGTSVAQILYLEDSTAGVAVNTGGSDRITYLAITADGTNTLTLAENDIETISITGAGDLTLLSARDPGTTLVRVATVLGSEARGNLTLDLSTVDPALTAAAVVRADTGSGNDVITVSAFDNQVAAGAGNDRVIIGSGLDIGDLLDGGVGTDVLVMTSADVVATALDTALLANLTGFEAIGVSDAFSASDPVDISAYGVNTVVIEDGLSGNVTLTGFTDGATVEIRTDAAETDVLSVVIPGATDAGSGSDVLNILLNADLEASDDIRETAVDVPGINTLQVTTADLTADGESLADGTLPDGSDGYALVLTNDSNLSSIVVGGAHAFSYASTVEARLETVIAQGMTGNMILDFKTAYGGTQGVTVTTGEGADTVTGSVYADVIACAGGDDTVHVTTGGDLVLGGGGADTFVVDTAGISTDTSYTRIGDFSAVADTAAADRITNVSSTVTADAAAVDVASAEASGGGGMTITADAVSGMISLAGADAARIDTVAEWLAVVSLVCESGRTCGFEFSGNTYVAEAGGSGGLDSLVELTGVTGVSAVGNTPGDNIIFLSA